MGPTSGLYPPHRRRIHTEAQSLQNWLLASLNWIDHRKIPASSLAFHLVITVRWPPLWVAIWSPPVAPISSGLSDAVEYPCGFQLGLLSALVVVLLLFPVSSLLLRMTRTPRSATCLRRTRPYPCCSSINQFYRVKALSLTPMSYPVRQEEEARRVRQMAQS
ncbi:hypothetical protein PCANC_23531 [Puccinia coronata f. sp. avenae]|uniref:Uncharacterized protein n=1 Tax=Puccinia coronata f. sp. avenae TaxID=200324 RepID=A0A2N5U610_9BASI|nr:hypothetical protein PCANC_23531 [Puccinia coronata f. sp. avenae]